LSAGH